MNKIKIILSIYIFLLVVLFILGCSNISTLRVIESARLTNPDIITLKPDFSLYDFDISELLDSLKYVKLELTENSLISNIDKIEIFEDNIYILDTNTSSLFVFSITGEFIYKINDVGNGPKEYVQLDFFSIDREKREIVLTDIMGYWVMRYDLDGNFINRTHIPIWIRGLESISNNQYALFHNYISNSHKLKNEFNLIYVDSLMNVKKAYFPYDSKKMGKASQRFSNPLGGNFHNYNNLSYFFMSYGDTIYSLRQEGVFPEYAIDFGNKKFNPDFLLTKTPEDIIQYINDEDFYRISKIFETKDLIVFCLTSPEGAIWTNYYSKETGNMINAFIFFNGTDSFHAEVMTYYDSWIVAQIPIQSWLLKKESYDEKIPTGKYIEKAQLVISALEMEDNPILMFYKLKKF